MPSESKDEKIELHIAGTCLSSIRIAIYALMQASDQSYRQDWQIAKDALMRIEKQLVEKIDKIIEGSS